MQRSRMMERFSCRFAQLSLTTLAFLVNFSRARGVMSPSLASLFPPAAIGVHSLAGNPARNFQSYDRSKKNTADAKASAVFLANNYNFDTNALFLEFMGQSNFRRRYASHSPNKSGFKTLSIVAYPTIFAPSWILIFLPIHIQCG